MKNKIICFLILIICFCISLTLCVGAVSEDTVYNWYCVRSKNNKQPVADDNMLFIENYDAYYIDHFYGDDNPEKVIYLTFDAGYENGNIARILDVMKEENVQGAFFVLENLIEKNTELCVRMCNEGHIVCNHTARHYDMTTRDSIDEFQAELKRLEDVYRFNTGREISKFYRPPEGKFDKRSLMYAKDMGYKTIFWSFAYEDWDNNAQPDPTFAKEKILSNVHNGAIILLHPTSKTNAEILGDVIRSLKSDGYRFGCLDDLVNSK